MSKPDLPNEQIPRPRAPFQGVHPSIPFIVITLILLYIGLNVWIFFYGTDVFKFNPYIKTAANTVAVIKDKEFKEHGQPTPPPNPERVFYPLPTGKQAWNFSYGPAARGPKVQTITVDPLTPDVDPSSPDADDMQTVSVAIKYTDPVTVVSATEFTDKQTNVHPLKLSSGTATDGIWSATWVMPDTYATIYHITLNTQSATGNWSGTIMFR